MKYIPDPLRAALLAQKSGADSITIHLREDRRHIRDKDLKKIKKKNQNTIEFRNGSHKRNVRYCN